MVRTRLDVRDPSHGLLAIIFVNYRSDQKLDLLVPGAMHEIYLASGSNAERVECNATYSDFRQFETAARVIPEPPN